MIEMVSKHNSDVFQYSGTSVLASVSHLSNVLTPVTGPQKGMWTLGLWSHKETFPQSDGKVSSTGQENKEKFKCDRERCYVPLCT